MGGQGSSSGYTRARGENRSGASSASSSQEQKAFEHKGSWPVDEKQRYAVWNKEVGEWRAETQNHPYSKREEPIQVPYYSYNNPNGTIASYGEGWENWYHVYRTSERNDKFIDAGKIEGFTIGEKVVDNGYHGEGTISSAILTGSPEIARSLGSVSFIVDHSDGSMSVFRPSDKRYRRL